MNALAALQPFAQAWRPVAPAGERCGMCAQAIDQEHHDHLVDVEQRSLCCACPSCAALFPSSPSSSPSPSSSSSPSPLRYRLVPNRVLVDPAFRLPASRWASLQIPVGLAFLFFNSRLARWVALYPSPAGAAEAALAPDAIAELAAATPLFAQAEPDVEALLFYGRRGADAFETFLVSIDACYRLVGRVRLHWQGFTGGDAAWREIERLFDDLRARAQPVVAP